MKKNAGYDLVSASGDASNRLIASGLVQPIDPKTIPNWNQLTPQLVKGPNHYVGGKYYGLPWQWGPNVLMWNAAKYKGVTNSWSALYDPKNKGKITIPNNPIQIADAALYLSKTKPSLGIKDPYELNSAQLHAAVAAAQATATADQGLLGLRDRRGQDLPDRRSHARRRLAARCRPAHARGHEGLADDSQGGRDRLVGRLDAGQEPQEPAVRAGLAEVRLRARRCRPRWPSSTPTRPANLQSCKALGATLCKQLHADGDTAYLNRIKFWKTPLSDCGNGKNECAPYSEWVQAWTSIKG